VPRVKKPRCGKFFRLRNFRLRGSLYISHWPFAVWETIFPSPAHQKAGGLHEIGFVAAFQLHVFGT
jgi:hypothetical protein